ncbi:MAG: hypothetical protein Q8O46_00605 [bacterium]|nr:hypothetical protein [bacterium]
MRQVKVIVIDGAMVVVEHGRVKDRDVMALDIKVNGDLDVCKVEPNTEEVLAMLGFPSIVDPVTLATEGQ